jgi:cyclopropane-fatty-acyl-phospholipid synthase
MTASTTQEFKLSGKSTARWSTRMARQQIFKRLRDLPRGSLVIEDADGVYRFGGSAGHPDPVAYVHVLDQRFYDEMAQGGSIAAAESYVSGAWRSPDLLKVMQLMAANVDLLNAIDDGVSVLERVAAYLFHLMNRNSLRGSRRNIQAHYDLGNEFFALFLDPTMMYSAALFPEPAATLEQASLHKLDRICRQLELSASDHLLEIGTGWGGMARYAARNYGCRVTTTTISQRQYEYAREQVHRDGLEDRVEVLMRDYRDLDGRYDKLVSIEMIEAVGHRYLPTFFQTCSRLLKPDGLMLLQAILMPDQRYARSKKSVDFIQRYIFPGGFLPSTATVAALTGSETDMQLIGVEDITVHYARTLAAWRSRFLSQGEELQQLGFDEQFQRLWEFYFCYCEGGFRERAIGTSQFLMAKPGYRTAGQTAN